uniref:Uncharacterized protein n=1 Tax=Bionectria ochroleuca TaxID=29856 RepID=A0A8H7NG42_BIOOC
MNTVHPRMYKFGNGSEKDRQVLEIRQPATIGDSESEVMIVTTRGVVSGRLIPGATSYRQPGCKEFRKVYIVFAESQVFEGDCGAAQSTTLSTKSSKAHNYSNVFRENGSFFHSNLNNSGMLNDWLLEDSKLMPWHNIGLVTASPGKDSEATTPKGTSEHGVATPDAKSPQMPPKAC